MSDRSCNACLEMEGRKQYHVARNTSFTYVIRLYIDGEEVNRVCDYWNTYDNTIEELHKAGFTEGFYNTEVARKKKNAEQAEQEYKYALENMIHTKENKL